MTPEPQPRASTAAYLGIAAHVLGVPAWQLATAGFISTLAGGLWLRRLV